GRHTHAVQHRYRQTADGAGAVGAIGRDTAVGIRATSRFELAVRSRPWKFLQMRGRFARTAFRRLEPGGASHAQFPSACLFWQPSLREALVVQNRSPTKKFLTLPAPHACGVTPADKESW